MLDMSYFHDLLGELATFAPFYLRSRKRELVEMAQARVMDFTKQLESLPLFRRLLQIALATLGRHGPVVK